MIVVDQQHSWARFGLHPLVLLTLWYVGLIWTKDSAGPEQTQGYGPQVDQTNFAIWVNDLTF